MTHERVGNKIQSIRKERGLTQDQLSKNIGVSRVSIVAIEKGHFLPTIATALRLAAALEMSLEELFWLKED